jgi:hypothetical protein
MRAIGDVRLDEVIPPGRVRCRLPQAPGGAAQGRGSGDYVLAPDTSSGAGRNSALAIRRNSLLDRS